MDFVINENKNVVESGFYLHIKTMFGDADHYETLVMGPFSHDEKHYMEQVINLLNSLRRKSSEEYDNNEDFNAWFREGDLEHFPQEQQDFIMELNIKSLGNDSSFGYWPSYEGYNYKFESLKVKYIDEDSNEFNVTIVN